MVFLRKDRDPDLLPPDRRDGSPEHASSVEHVDDSLLVHRQGDADG